MCRLHAASLMNAPGIWCAHKQEARGASPSTAAARPLSSSPGRCNCDWDWLVDRWFWLHQALYDIIAVVRSPFSRVAGINHQSRDKVIFAIVASKLKRVTVQPRDSLVQCKDVLTAESRNLFAPRRYILHGRQKPPDLDNLFTVISGDAVEFVHHQAFTVTDSQSFSRQQTGP